TCFGLIGWAYLRIHGQLSGIQVSIKLLERKEPNDVQQIINGLLEQAKSRIHSGDIPGGRQATLVATSIIDVSRKQKIPAGQKMFEDAINNLNELDKEASPELLPLIHQSRISLAQ